MLLTIGIALSLGAINAMIPILVILILLVASAGLNRGYSLFNFFGLSTLAGINPGGKASIAGKTGFGFPGAGFVGGGGKLPGMLGGKAAARLKGTIKSAYGKRVAATAIMRAAKPSPETNSLAKKAAAHPLTRAIFIDKPSSALSPGKVGVKNASGAFKYPRTQKVVAAVGNLSKSTSKIRNSAQVRKAKVLNLIKGQEGTKRNKIFESIKNPKTRLGKTAKTALKIAGISVIGTPVAGAAYGAMSTARWHKSRTPGQKQSKPNPPEKFHVFKTILKHPSVKGMGNDVAAILSPPVFAARIARRAAGYHSKTTEKAIKQANSQKSQIIDKRSEKGLNTQNYRPTGDIHKKDLAHGKALITAQKHLEEKGKSYDELSKSEKKELRKMVNSDLAPAYHTTPTTLTAMTRGMINIAKEVASGEKLTDVIKDRARNMGKSSNSSGSARMARALTDIAFLTREGLGAARSSSAAGGRWLFSPKNQREALAHLPVSDEAREAAGLKPLTERQKDLLLGAIDINISAERHPDALRQHYSRIMGELELLGSSSAPTAKATKPNQPSSTASVVQLGEDKNKEAQRAEVREGLTRQIELIANNKNTPQDVLDKLSNHSNAEIRAAALGNGNLGEDKRKDLVNNHTQENIDTKAMQLIHEIDERNKAAMESSNEEAGHKEKIPDLLVDLKGLSSNPNLSTEEISSILTATEQVSQFASTPAQSEAEKDVKKALLSSSEEIEGKLVSNKEISTSDLNMLATNSTSEKVRDAAEKMLVKKGIDPSKSKAFQVKDSDPSPPDSDNS